MKYTKVFATQEEFDDLLSLTMKGWTHGDVVIVTSVMEGIMKDKATTDARVACHKLALSHGLPEIEGYYGINKAREFMTV